MGLKPPYRLVSPDPICELNLSFRLTVTSKQRQALCILCAYLCVVVMKWLCVVCISVRLCVCEGGGGGGGGCELGCVLETFRRLRIRLHGRDILKDRAHTRTFLQRLFKLSLGLLMFLVLVLDLVRLLFLFL